MFGGFERQDHPARHRCVVVAGLDSVAPAPSVILGAQAELGGILDRLLELEVVRHQQQLGHGHGGDRVVVDPLLRVAAAVAPVLGRVAGARCLLLDHVLDGLLETVNKVLVLAVHVGVAEAGEGEDRQGRDADIVLFPADVLRVAIGILVGAGAASLAYAGIVEARGLPAAIRILVAIEPLESGEDGRFGSLAAALAGERTLTVAMPISSGRSTADSDGVVDHRRVLVDVGEVVEVSSLGNISGDLVDLTLDDGFFDDLRVEDLGRSLQIAFFLRVVLRRLFLQLGHHIDLLLFLGDLPAEHQASDDEDQDDVEDGRDRPIGHFSQPAGLIEKLLLAVHLFVIFFFVIFFLGHRYAPGGCFSERKNLRFQYRGLWPGS